MTEHDPLDDRLRDGFHQMAEPLQPAPVADPAALADELMTRSVPPTPTGRGPLGGWRGIGAVAAVVAAGAGVGAWLGTTNSDSDTAGSADAVSVASVQLWRCPADGVVGQLTSGDRVVLTGRSTDGAWLELRHPVDLSARAWVSADVVDADAAPDALPVVECPNPTAATANPDDVTTTTIASPTTVPSSTTVPPSGPTTTLRANPGPTPSTTVATPSTTTPPAADSTGPTLANVGASPSTVWTLEQPGVPCPADKRIWTSTVSAFVTDAGGVASVRLDWSVNGRSGTVTMTPTGSTWRGTIGPFATDTLPTSGAGMNQTVSVTVRATDAAGNVSTASTSFGLRSSAECFG